MQIHLYYLSWPTKNKSIVFVVLSIQWMFPVFNKLILKKKCSKYTIHAHENRRKSAIKSYVTLKGDDSIFEKLSLFTSIMITKTEVCWRIKRKYSYAVLSF